MRNLILILVLASSLHVVLASNNQATDPLIQQSMFDLVNHQEITEVTLEMNLDEMLSNRRSQKEFKAQFSFADANGQAQSWETEVKIRGKYRRSKCTEMPPLKLNFKKGDLAKSGLALFDDFKLVTQCVEDETIARELLLKEYLAYKIYNEITDYSFRVQFLKINYKDAVSGRIDEQWGFIIEDAAEMRARLGAEKHTSKYNVPSEQVNRDLFKTMALFQYMIGNLDWDLFKRSHNVKVINKNGQLLAIPYDFDFSGLVGAPYSTLNPNYDVKSIKDRFYLGNPEDLEEMNETIDLFESKRKVIIQMIKDFKSLKREERRELISYINSFYRNVDKIRLPEVKPNQVLSVKK